MHHPNAEIKDGKTQQKKAWIEKKSYTLFADSLMLIGQAENHCEGIEKNSLKLSQSLFTISTAA